MAYAFNPFTGTLDYYQVSLGGDVVGPASSSDNAIARYEGTTGKLIQNSSVVILDNGFVGIGTPIPNVELQVVGAIGVGARISMYDSNESIDFKWQNVAGIGGATYNGSVVFEFDGASYSLFAAPAAGTIFFNIGSTTEVSITADAITFNNGSGDTSIGWATNNQLNFTATTSIFSGTVQGTRFISTIATGTAPFTVASTTLVTNLNADLVDGVHVATLTNTRLLRYNSSGTQIENSTVTETSGALGSVTTINMSGQLTSTLATGTAPFVVASTTLVTNLNADLLDGKNTGTSGNTIPLLDGTNTWSAVNTFTSINLSASSGQIVFDSGSLTTTTLQDSAATSSKTLTLPNVTSTLAAIGLAQTWTAQQTYAANIIPSGSRDLGGALTVWNFVYASNWSDGINAVKVSEVARNNAANTFTVNQIISNTAPTLTFTDTTASADDWSIGASTDNTFTIRNTTDGRDDLQFDGAGAAVFGGAVTTGALTCTTINTGNGAVELAAGTYTPTRSAEANLDSNVTMSEAQYLRVGNTVTVSGRFTADPTLTATATSFEITLPVASDIGAVEDCAGTAFSGAIAGMGAAITGSVANNTAVFTWVSTDITSQSWSYQFTYQVI